ncbi:MAG: DUF2723 domain-containing protein [Chloroflexi bacterium]|nr:DUF2723 domain-containing protein [Chloroflexota bacterium]
MSRRPARELLLLFSGALLLLLGVYLSTLQTIPNGSEHYYMIDVGETQIVLNVWGTLHATGYPLFTMTGSIAVTVLKAFGIPAATAPALVSLLWGLGALTVMFVLARHVTPQRRWLTAACLIVVYGLTRTVWIHQVIAEIYSMTLFVMATLLFLALCRPPIPGRLYWLALLGGIALGHHRALITLIPALLYALYPDLLALLRRRPLHLVALLALGLIGLVPYGYMMLRADANAPWVYGNPNTFQGLWDQFIGTEASRFIGMPATLDGVIANFRLVTDTILTDLSWAGVLLGMIGLVAGALRPATRRAAVTLLLSGAAAYLFHCLFYTDILSALILAATFSLAFGWLFLADQFLTVSADASFAEKAARLTARAEVLPRVALVVVTALCALAFYAANQPFILSLTTDRTGLETIALAQHTPPGSTLMMAWGPRYFAVGFARSVLGALPGVDLVDHKADYRAILAEGSLVTPSYTFYRQPPEWWEAQIGEPIYLNAVAPDLVEITTHPDHLPSTMPVAGAAGGVSVYTHRLSCTPLDLVLEVNWIAHEKPKRDLSVFVHLLDSDGNVMVQDDQRAPVYGWRPISSWSQGEIVRDFYSLPRLSAGKTVRYGLYSQRDDGSFMNELVVEVPVTCNGAK